MQKLNEHELWLSIANNDLQAAKVLLQGKLYSTGIYHCQQVAEKSLKGYLAFKEQDILKIHDLVALAKQCIQLDQSFYSIVESAEELKPWSTRSRYPDDFVEVEKSELQKAIEQAEQIFLFIK